MGVSAVRSGSFAASITVDRKRYHLGTFETKEEAIAARLNAEREHFGDFARRAANGPIGRQL